MPCECSSSYRGRYHLRILSLQSTGKRELRRRFDSFKSDEHNGEITYEYSFLTRHGIFKDDLEAYFYAVVGSAVSCYDDIRKCSVGRFKSKEANEIIQKVNALVSDIKE